MVTRPAGNNVPEDSDVEKYKRAVKLIQCTDDCRLTLVKRDAKDDGIAMEILGGN